MNLVFQDVSKLIDKLVTMGILETDDSYTKLAYKYKNIYNVFVGKEV